MTETVQKKIVLKIFDKPLADDELDKYAKAKKIDITKFSDSAFILGEIMGEKGIDGLLGLVREDWPDLASYHPNYDMLNRITVKLYETSGKNLGQIEERLIKELSLSEVGGKLPIFTVSLKDFQYDIDIDKESDRLIFALLTNTRKGILDIFQIMKKTFAIRSHFLVKRKFWDQRVAVINSKGGGKVEIKIFDEDLARNEHFINFLVLFSGTIKFHDEIANKIQDAKNALTEGTLIIKPSKQALEMVSASNEAKFTETGQALLTEKIVGSKKVEKARLKKEEQIKPEVEKEKFVKEKPQEVKKPLKKEKLRKLPKEKEVEIPPKKVEIKPVPREEVVPKKSVKLEPLYLEDSVKKITGITEEMSTILEDVGISIIDDLLFVDADVLAGFIAEESITAEKIEEWQISSKKRIETTTKKAEIEKAEFLKKYEKRKKEDKLI